MLKTLARNVLCKPLQVIIWFNKHGRVREMTIGICAIYTPFFKKKIAMQYNQELTQNQNKAIFCDPVKDTLNLFERSSW